MSKKLLTILSILVALLFIIFSLLGKKDQPAENNTANSPTFEIKNIKIEWTGYKTNDKIGVKGTFKSVNFHQNSDSNPLNGLQVEIPVSSLFSNEEIRDDKLKNIFFGSMLETTMIKGKVTIEDNKSAIVDLTMNGTTKALPMTYSHNKETNSFNFNGKMVITNWGANKALKAISDACFDLHKGADGVSVTWDEVDITVDVNLK